MKYLLVCAEVLIVTTVFLLIGCDKDDDKGGGGGSPTGISISAGDISGPGQTYHYAMAECTYDCSFENGASGSNRVWSFPDFDWSYSWSKSCIAPQDAPGASNFPTADRAWENGEYSDYFDFESITEDGCYSLGTASSYYADVYPEPELLMRLPLRVGTEWSAVDYDVYWYEDNDSTYDIYSVTYRGDAWGTLITPYDTCSCVRVFGHIAYSTHEAGQETLLREEYYGYFWYDEFGNQVVCTYSSENHDQDFSSGYISMRVPQAVTSNYCQPKRLGNGAQCIQRF